MKMKVHTSIKQAAEITGVSKAVISGVLRNLALKGGGYIWRYGDGPLTLNLEGYWQKGRKAAAVQRYKKVTQYNMSGE